MRTTFVCTEPVQALGAHPKVLIVDGGFHIAKRADLDSLPDHFKREKWEAFPRSFAKATIKADPEHYAELKAFIDAK